MHTIDDLKLKVRTKNALLNNRFKLVDLVGSRAPTRLLKSPQIGRQTVREIFFALQRLGVEVEWNLTVPAELKPRRRSVDLGECLSIARGRLERAHNGVVAMVCNGAPSERLQSERLQSLQLEIDQALLTIEAAIEEFNRW